MLAIDVKSVYSLLLEHSHGGGAGQLFKYCQVELPAPLEIARFALATRGHDFISQLDVFFQSQKCPMTPVVLLEAVARRFGNRWAGLPDESRGYLMDPRSDHPSVELHFSPCRVRLMVGAWGAVDSQVGWYGMMAFTSAADQQRQLFSLLDDRLSAERVHWLSAGDYHQFVAWMSDLEAVANTVVDTVIANAPPSPVANEFREKNIQLILSIAGSEPIPR